MLASAADAYRMFEDDRTKFAAFVAFLFTLGGFSFVEWWLRRSERAPLYVSLVLFAAGAWQACASKLVYSESRAWATVLMRFEFGLVSIIGACGCLAVRELLGGRRRPVERMLVVLAVVAAVSTVTFPVPWVQVALRLDQIVAVASIVYIFSMTIRALARGNRTMDTIVLRNRDRRSLGPARDRAERARKAAPRGDDDGVHDVRILSGGRPVAACARTAGSSTSTSATRSWRCFRATLRTPFARRSRCRGSWGRAS